MFHCQNSCNIESLSRKGVLSSVLERLFLLEKMGPIYFRPSGPFFFSSEEGEGLPGLPVLREGKLALCRGTGSMLYTTPHYLRTGFFILSGVPSPFTHLLPSLSFFTLLFLDYTYNVIFQFAAFHRLYIFFNLLIQNATMNNLIDK